MEYWNAFLSYCDKIAAWIDWAAVEKWQMLLAGLLVLLAAFLGAMIIGRQIGRSRREAEEMWRKDEAAMRAVLPLAVAELGRYAADCIRLLHVYVANGNSPPVLPPDISAPRIPSQIAPALLASVRLAREPAIVTQVEALLGKLLLQHSRLEGMLARHRSALLHQADGLVALRDAADLHAATSAFAGSMRTIEAVARLAPPEQLANALRISGIRDEEHPIYRHLVPYVINPDRVECANNFAEVSEKDRPVKLFTSLHEARSWIEKRMAQAPGAYDNRR
jgi:hypothetical protein